MYGWKRHVVRVSILDIGEVIESDQFEWKEVWQMDERVGV